MPKRILQSKYKIRKALTDGYRLMKHREAKRAEMDTLFALKGRPAQTCLIPNLAARHLIAWKGTVTASLPKEQ